MDSNKQAIVAFFQATNDIRNNKAGWDDLQALLDPDFKRHTSGKTMDLATFKQFAMAPSASFSDAKSTIEDLIAEGDRVVARVMWQGKHTGAFQTVEPSGKVLAVEGIHIFRLSGGKIMETWEVADVFGMMQQLGLG